MKEPVLHRCLGLRECITITAGTVIGVGLFTLGGNAVGMLGKGIIFATLAALAISIYPALLYAEMGASLPFAGGTYQYALRGLGRPLGVLAGLNFIISMVSVASGEALAFSFYFRTLLDVLGLHIPISDTALACIMVVVFLIIGIRGAEITGRLQNGFLFFFWGVAAVWILNILPSLHFGGQEAILLNSPNDFLKCVTLIWWCFAGFETCCALGEEICFPQINLPRALFLAPFLVFATTALSQWALVCLTPPESLAALAQAAAPYAFGMRAAGIIGFPLLLLCAGVAFGGDFSTLNASISAPARYLHAMARDGALPAVFSKLHPKYRTPYIASLTLGALMLVLVATGSITYIASLSLFATLTYYIIGILAACGLRRKFPTLPRPYRAPGIVIGAPVSIVLYLILITQLEFNAVLLGILWCILGLLIGVFWHNKTPNIRVEILEAQTPSKQIRLKMDRQWHIWCAAVAGLTVFVLLLYWLIW